MGQPCGSVTAGYLAGWDNSLITYAEHGWMPRGLQLQCSPSVPTELIAVCCVNGAIQSSYHLQRRCSQDQLTHPYTGKEVTNQSLHQSFNST